MRLLLLLPLLIDFATAVSAATKIASDTAIAVAVACTIAECLLLLILQLLLLLSFLLSLLLLLLLLLLLHPRSEGRSRAGLPGHSSEKHVIQPRASIHARAAATIHWPTPHDRLSSADREMELTNSMQSELFRVCVTLNDRFQQHLGHKGNQRTRTASAAGVGRSPRIITNWPRHQGTTP